MSYELSKEEEQQVLYMRQAAKLKEEERLKLEAKKANSTTLEASFKKELDKSHVEILKLIAEADELLKKAVALSDASGIPFSCDLVALPDSRMYQPASFSDKWDDVDYHLLRDANIHLTGDIGWEHWNTSSLKC